MTMLRKFLGLSAVVVACGGSGANQPQPTLASATASASAAPITPEMLEKDPLNLFPSGAQEEWTYLFFVEVSGHTTDRPLVSAFEDVRHKTRFFKVLGSYPSI